MKREYRKPLFRKIYLTYVMIAFSVLGVFLAFGLSAFRSFYYDSTRSALEARGKLISGEISSLLVKKDYGEVQRRVKRMGRETGTRFTVILPSGRVVGDSERDPSGMDNHGDRPEIVQALRDDEGSSVRHSHTLDEDHMYLALPLRSDGAVRGVIRSSLPLTAVQAALWRVYTQLFIGALVLLAFAAGVSWWITSTISDPLERMKNLAERIAQGDFAARMKMERSDALEIERAGRAMNKISIQLAHRIETILEQKAEQEAVFSSMIEGVIAIDADRRIMHVNAAAEQTFGLNRETDIGRPLHEIVRMTDLHEIADRAVDSDEPVESELTINDGGGQCYLQVHGTALIGVKGDHSGAVLVFNDVTRLRALENHRRDFVSNVSHELRTPLTSIQGFVETLLEGAYKSPEDCERFLMIIQRQAGRLAAIVEDLLDLSKIEAQSDRKDVPLTMQHLKPLLESAMEVCGPKAAAKKIIVELVCPGDLMAPVNAPLLEQAIINLVDNAVKYSDQARDVRVEVTQRREWVSVTVADQGVGIPREHLPRIFERFYRVDKARSRLAGGTGLGLAIVKHIALAHHGMARVESEPGKGSRFILDLPGVSS